MSKHQSTAVYEVTAIIKGARCGWQTLRALTHTMRRRETARFEKPPVRMCELTAKVSPCLSQGEVFDDGAVGFQICDAAPSHIPVATSRQQFPP
jgi:hypothetical protein